MDDFISQCCRVVADLYYPIVPKEVNERYYPGCKRTYVRFKEGTFTGGNLFMVNPNIVDQCMGIAARIIENRKKPLHLCHILGWSYVFRFFLGSLRLKDVEQRVGSFWGCLALWFNHPTLNWALMWINPSDLALVRGAFIRA